MASPDNAIIIESGVYTIQNKGSGTFVDLKDGSTANEAPMVGYENLSSKTNFFNENWYILRVSNTKFFNIVNVTGGTAVDLYGASPANGTKVQGYAPHGGPNQQWYFLDGGDGAYYIINVATNTAIDLDNGKAANDTKIQGWTFQRNNNNQRWVLSARHRSIQSVQSLLINGNVATQLPDYYASARLYITPPSRVVEEVYAKWKAAHNFQFKQDLFDRDSFVSVFKGEVTSWGYDNIRVPIGLLFGTLGSIGPTAVNVWNWTLTDDLKHIALWDAQNGNWWNHDIPEPATIGFF